MFPEELNVRKAIADVELIRRVLDQAEHNDRPAQTTGLFGVTLTANLILQGLALGVSALLLLIETLSGGALTKMPGGTKSSTAGRADLGPRRHQVAHGAL